MKAVMRLVYTYFMGTPITRALTISAIVLCVAAQLSVTYLPQTKDMLAFALVGQLALFLGSALMPVIFGRLAQGHALQLAPMGRVKLLLSALLTVIIVALPAGLLMPSANAAGNNVSLSEVLKYPGAARFLIDMGLVVYTSLMLLVGWLYLAMWFLISQRDRMGLAKALIIIVIIVFVPVREIQELSGKTAWNLIQLAIIWTVFSVGFLAWPRIKALRARRATPARGQTTIAARDTWGREVALVLGTSNPWVLVGSLALPLFIATKAGVEYRQVWLFMLTIFSTVSGAIAGQAAQRSRALWLRQGWSRVELFAQVERAFWRHNTVVLGLLLALMAGIGGYVQLPGQMIAGGLPLLALGTVLSTYLGFMLTRGLRWLEISLGSAVMLTLMAVALLLGSHQVDLAAVFVTEGVLVLLALVLRAVGRRRWSRIDWTECRPPRMVRARGG